MQVKRIFAEDYLNKEQRRMVKLIEQTADNKENTLNSDVLSVLGGAMWCFFSTDTYEDYIKMSAETGAEIRGFTALSGLIGGVYYKKEDVNDIYKNNESAQKIYRDCEEFFSPFEDFFCYQKLFESKSFVETFGNENDDIYTVHDEFIEFTRLVTRPDYFDFDYLNTLEKYNMINLDMKEKIKIANAEGLLAIFTSIIRLERFSRGFMGKCIKDGVFLEIIKRSKELT